MGQKERELLAIKVSKTFRVENPPSNIVYDPSYVDALLLDQSFRNKRWTEISFETMKRHKYELSLLCPEAFHYYLPAFMTFSLTGPEEADTLIDNLISNLADPLIDGDALSSQSLLTFSTTEERSVIREFLSSYLALYDEPHWHHDNETLLHLNKALKRWSDLDQP